ncbi:MAG: hypothetical protein ABIT01_09010, partial [Thermoanaerobaculia bacterium]
AATGTGASGRAQRTRGAGAGYSADTIPTLAIDVNRGPMIATVQRNVFRFYDRPTPVPTNPPPAPTRVPMMGDPLSIGPSKPTPPPPPTPIVPPVIPYKAVGIFGPKEQPIVALEDNGRLINARTGDTLDGRFIIRQINQESVDFGFVGLPPEITRRLAMSQPEGVR